ncbi:MAG TPA: hypothetical protein VKX49_27910 [Bryobacteraceae bacterium]|nr:hypothetical protein [Bryobacteraceae bacterium]
MDVERTLRELYSEKKILDSAISTLERRLRQNLRTNGPNRRGRRNMSAEERRAVSERMTRYWEARRAQAQALESAASAAARSSGD